MNSAKITSELLEKILLDLLPNVVLTGKFLMSYEMDVIEKGDLEIRYLHDTRISTEESVVNNPNVKCGFVNIANIYEYPIVIEYFREKVLEEILL